MTLDEIQAILSNASDAELQKLSETKTPKPRKDEKIINEQISK